MAKSEYKIPEKFRKLVEPTLLNNEKILSTFQESFSFFGESVLPKLAILTNLRIIILTREVPGVRMEEFHLQGMTVELFQDKIGMYNSIEFLLNNTVMYKLEVVHKRWAEAEKFVHEVIKNIGQLEYETRSESDNPGGNNPDTQTSPKNQQK